MKETEMVDVLIGASYEGKTPSPFVKGMEQYVEVPVGEHTTYWLRVSISQKNIGKIGLLKTLNCY